MQIFGTLISITVGTFLASLAPITAEYASGWFQEVFEEDVTGLNRLII